MTSSASSASSMDMSTRIKVSRREKSFTGNGKEGKYYLTGDKAKWDKEGYLWYVGRSDDVINSSGYRIGLFIGTKISYFEN
jgi:acyl-coenzyme A synthetase/AMP-(fatty) acid ligase